MDLSKKNLRVIIALVACVSCLFGCLFFVTAQAQAETQDQTDPQGQTQGQDQEQTQTVQKSSSKIVMLKGTTQKVKYGSKFGTIKYTLSKKNIIKVTRTSKYRFKVKALKNGTVTVVFKSDKIYDKYKVTVSSGNKFVNKWTKNIANQIKKKTSDAKEQLILGSEYIVGNFSYANVYDSTKVISKRKGNCYSAGKILAKIYNALGYKATVRYAVKDKKSRYPSNITFASEHYNVKVKAKGKTYYLDATPAMGFVYISSSKKPLAEYMNLGGGWMKVM